MKLKNMNGKTLRAGLVCAALAATAGCVTFSDYRPFPPSADDAAERALRDSLTFYAGFDNGLDADFAKGDPTLYSAPSSRDRNEGVALPGLPGEGHVKELVGQGRFGNGLQWTKKAKPVVFFRGPENMGFKSRDWSASVSLWMRLNPDKDLEPGYCDPFQFVGENWGDGSFFIEFTKENPRSFRFVQMAITKLWNPTGAKYEEIPLGQRPLVQVEKPPFSAEEWTHVVFTFEHANTGQKDGVGRLYLNGEYQGAIAGFNSRVGWTPEKAAINLGLNYIGGLDDIAVFDRALTAEEAKWIHDGGGPLGELLD